MKFGIDFGHNCPPADTGATGLENEDVLTKAVGKALVIDLTNKGHQAIICTPKSAVSLNSSLRQRVNIANENKVDLYVSIHFNKYQDTPDPMGTEIFAMSPAATLVANKVFQNLTDLGFKKRSVKKESFYVLKQTQMPAILIEVCFLDSEADILLFRKLGADKVAAAISDAIA